MVDFRKVYIPVLSILALMQVFLLVSCKSQDDFSYSGDSTTTKANYTDTINVIRSHTEGQGFPIVIMADGYTVSDITDGTYRKAILKADTALFSMEPMKSLKQYFDIIEVKVPSAESGITSTKKNTAFKTYYTSGQSTEIYGDNTTVQNWMGKALIHTYGITTKAVMDAKVNICQAIVLLNSSAYKGITMLAIDTTVTDSIPQGFSLSYIPVDASYNYSTGTALKNRNVFTDLIQHEAVGHGIGKLADEYFEPSTESPADSDIVKYKKFQKYGVAMNAAYDPIAARDTFSYFLIYDNKTILVNKHHFYTTDMAYPLTQDTLLYGKEDLTWYQGGYTFLTYTRSINPLLPYYICRKNFYRPSMYSTMNATTDENNKLFNAVSRLAIYKRVKRAALGSSFNCNLHNATDLKAFKDFDAAGREASIAAYQQVLAELSKTISGAKGTRAAVTDRYVQGSEAPTLAAPKIIKNPKF